MTPPPVPSRTAVVLGGTGYVGRWVCAALVAAGWSVVAASRSAAPVADCRSVRLDAALDAPGTAALLRAHRPGLVVDAAGAAWQLDGPHLEQANVDLVQNVVRALGTHDPCPRLVHLGTVYEYGPQPCGAALREDTAAHPETDYARTKLRGTEAVLAAGHLDAVVLRLTTAVGAGAPPQSLFALVSAQLAAGGPVRLATAGLAREQDFVDVRDVADAVVAAGSARGVRGVLNIGSGTPHRVGSAVDTLVAISGVPTGIVPAEDAPAGRQRGAPSARPQRVSVDAARRELGWVPRRTLHDALTAVWRSAAAPAATGRRGT